MLGAGGFSVVALVKDRSTESLYACKVTHREFLIQEGILDRFEREARLLASFSYPSIVQLHDIVYERDFFGLVMEYCEPGDLFDILTTSGKLHEFTAQHLFKQLVAAVEYIHARNIVHRDLSPKNCLITFDMRLKVADFGLCHQTKPDPTAIDIGKNLEFNSLQFS